MNETEMDEEWGLRGWIINRAAFFINSVDIYLFQSWSKELSIIN